MSAFLVKKALLIPKTFFSVFGCFHCEWKCTDQCPRASDNFVHDPRGICDERLLWLASFLPDYSKRPSVDTVRLDFLKTLGMDRMLKEYEFIKASEEKVRAAREDYESILRFAGASKSEVNRARIKLEFLERVYDKERFGWERLWKKLAEHADFQVGRETPKKVEVKQERSIKPSDIKEFIRNNSIDVSASASGVVL